MGEKEERGYQPPTKIRYADLEAKCNRLQAELVVAEAKALAISQAGGIEPWVTEEIRKLERERDEARAYEIDFTGRLGDQIKINGKLRAELRAKRMTLRGIEGVLKLWASVINPDYKKIYVQILQILKDAK